jgi:ribonuclease P protein subunit RPR2
MSFRVVVTMSHRKGRRGRRTRATVNLVRNRIKILFRLAEEEARQPDRGRADRYVELARKLGMRYNVRIPRHLKRRICRKCHAYLVPGRNATVRVRRGRIIVHCHECGRILRYPFK